MAYKQLALRPNVAVTSTVHAWISKLTCWHFDAWFRRGIGDTLYMRIETRAGGRDLITSALYLIEGGRLRYVTDLGEPMDDCTMLDRWLSARYDELNALHWRYVYPLCQRDRMPLGFKSRSVALHYIRVPSLDPIAPGTINFFGAGALRKKRMESEIRYPDATIGRNPPA